MSTLKYIQLTSPRLIACAALRTFPERMLANRTYQSNCKGCSEAGGKTKMYSIEMEGAQVDNRKRMGDND